VILEHSNTGIVGSNLARCIAVCPCVCVVLCYVGRDFEMGRFKVQEVLVSEVSPESEDARVPNP
jgi:hypothetical protein